MNARKSGSALSTLPDFANLDASDDNRKLAFRFRF